MSSEESKRTRLVPDWSQLCISRQQFSMHVFRKLCIDFEVSSTPSPRCLQCPLRSLRTHAWFLTGVNGVFHIKNAVCMSPQTFVSILKSLAFLKVPHLLGVSRASSKRSKRTCLVPDRSQWCILCQEYSMHVSWKLCFNFEVSSLLRSTPSPRCLQSVLQGV